MAPDRDCCDYCNGAGRLFSDNGPAPRITTCWECDGAGSWEAECEFCSGPLFDGLCPECDSLAPVTRIAPGRIAA